ncbi:MAG: OmpA family protein, partial [Vicinamibacterales bacterium]
MGAKDWTAILDRVCHIPIFSLHFSHELSMSYQDSRPSLEKLAALLRARSDLRIEVQGHVDNVGTEKELVNLSTSRAAIVNAA